MITSLRRPRIQQVAGHEYPRRSLTVISVARSRSAEEAVSPTAKAHAQSRRCQTSQAGTVAHRYLWLIGHRINRTNPQNGMRSKRILCNTLKSQQSSVCVADLLTPANLVLSVPAMEPIVEATGGGGLVLVLQDLAKIGLPIPQIVLFIAAAAAWLIFERKGAKEKVSRLTDDLDRARNDAEREVKAAKEELGKLNVQLEKARDALRVVYEHIREEPAFNWRWPWAAAPHPRGAVPTHFNEPERAKPLVVLEVFFDADRVRLSDDHVAAIARYHLYVTKRRDRARQIVKKHYEACASCHESVSPVIHYLYGVTNHDLVLPSGYDPDENFRPAAEVHRESFEQVRSAYQSAINGYRAAPDKVPFVETAASAHNNLALLLFARGEASDKALALEHAENAVALHESSASRRPALFASAYDTCARIRWWNNKWGDAMDASLRAVEIRANDCTGDAAAGLDVLDTTLRHVVLSARSEGRLPPAQAKAFLDRARKLGLDRPALSGVEQAISEMSTPPPTPRPAQVGRRGKQ